MPKRPNPFGEASPLQYKTHIGKKEVDLGVNMDENMRNVYERTKSLLFEGSRRAVDCSSCDQASDWTAMDDREELRPLPGQLRIATDGQLHPQVALADTNGASAACMDTEVNGSAEVQMEAETKVNTPVKQLRIDTSGRLCSDITEAGASQATTSTGCRFCHSCNRPVHISPRQCFFCDKNTCSNCLLQCVHCRGLFCQFCCVMNYDDCLERPFCLQCSN